MKNILDKINRADEIQSNLELDKTELGTHEIELASLDMIKAMLNDSNATYKKGLDWTKEMEAFTKKARVLNAEAKGLISGLTKELNDFKQQVTQLGLKAETLPEFKKANDSLGPLDNIVKMTQKYI
jgi:exonuclease VII small subunit